MGRTPRRKNIDWKICGPIIIEKHINEGLPANSVLRLIHKAHGIHMADQSLYRFVQRYKRGDIDTHGRSLAVDDDTITFKKTQKRKSKVMRKQKRKLLDLSPKDRASILLDEYAEILKQRYHLRNKTKARDLLNAMKRRYGFKYNHAPRDWLRSQNVQESLKDLGCNCKTPSEFDEYILKQVGYEDPESLLSGVRNAPKAKEPRKRVREVKTQKLSVRLLIKVGNEMIELPTIIDPETFNFCSQVLNASKDLNSAKELLNQLAGTIGTYELLRE